jgi:hypothetical protein
MLIVLVKISLRVVSLSARLRISDLSARLRFKNELLDLLFFEATVYSVYMVTQRRYSCIVMHLDFVRET